MPRVRRRIFPNVKVRVTTPNASSRNGVTIDRIVIHDTEGHNLPGTGDLEGVMRYSVGAKVSFHAVTDAEGQSGRLVHDNLKAWHCVEYNSRSLGIEQIGFASQNKWPAAQLKETARWVAMWSHKHGIPIDSRHVVTHASLGISGGGHHDPGPNYPMKTMLRYARKFYKLQAKHYARG